VGFSVRYNRAGLLLLIVIVGSSSHAFSTSQGQAVRQLSLDEIASKHLRWKQPDFTNSKTPVQRFGLPVYSGKPDPTSLFTTLEAEIRRRMRPGGAAAKTDFERRLQAVRSAPGDTRTVFAAFVATSLRRIQQYELGHPLSAYETSNVITTLATLLAATKTKDPLALAWLLTFELDMKSPIELPLRDKLLRYGRALLKDYPTHLELQIAVAFAMANRTTSPLAAEGDRMVHQLESQHPQSLFVASLRPRIALNRFTRTKDAAEGRRALRLYRELKVRFPVGSDVRVKWIPAIEAMILRFFKRFDLKP